MCLAKAADLTSAADFTTQESKTVGNGDYQVLGETILLVFKVKLGKRVTPPSAAPETFWICSELWSELGWRSWWPRRIIQPTRSGRMCCSPQTLGSKLEPTRQPAGGRWHEISGMESVFTQKIQKMTHPINWFISVAIIAISYNIKGSRNTGITIQKLHLNIQELLFYT